MTPTAKKHAGADDPVIPQSLVTRTADETRQFAARLARACGPGAIFALHGDLGAGKTCFAQGLGNAWGVHEPVCSPTYVLVHEYEGERPLVHIDLYRLNGPDEVLALGWDEMMESGAVIAVEWADRADGLFPPETVHVELRIADAYGRNARHIRVWRESAPS